MKSHTISNTSRYSFY